MVFMTSNGAARYRGFALLHAAAPRQKIETTGPAGRLQLSLSALITFPHLSYSACRNAANCSGVVVVGSSAERSSGVRYSGVAASLTISPCSLVTTSLGVAAGAAREYHDGASTPRMPCSTSVGISVALGERCGLVTARPMSRWLWRWDRMAVVPATI